MRCNYFSISVNSLPSKWLFFHHCNFFSFSVFFSLQCDLRFLQCDLRSFSVTSNPSVWLQILQCYLRFLQCALRFLRGNLGLIHSNKLYRLHWFRCTRHWVCVSLLSAQVMSGRTPLWYLVREFGPSGPSLVFPTGCSTWSRSQFVLNLLEIVPRYLSGILGVRGRSMGGRGGRTRPGSLGSLLL